jgi:hypothetical protein
LRGAVEAGFSAARGAALLLLLFTIAAGLATLLFALAGLADAVAALFGRGFGLAIERDVLAAFEAAALVLAFFITSLRLTEFSGKGNPSVEAGRFLHRVLVDEAFDRLIEHPLLDRRFLRFAGQCVQSRELRKSRLAQSGGTRLPRSHD